MYQFKSLLQHVEGPGPPPEQSQSLLFYFLFTQVGPIKIKMSLARMTCFVCGQFCPSCWGTHHVRLIFCPVCRLQPPPADHSIKDDQRHQRHLQHGAADITRPEEPPNKVQPELCCICCFVQFSVKLDSKMFVTRNHLWGVAARWFWFSRVYLFSFVLLMLHLS